LRIWLIDQFLPNFLRIRKASMLSLIRWRENVSRCVKSLLFLLATGALCASALFLPPSAEAATVVSGDLDTNAPLELDPGPNGTDPLTAPLLMSASPEVVRIQRMPVTKRIQRVTIGDVARGAACTSNPQLRLWVNGVPRKRLREGARPAVVLRRIT